MPIGIAITPDGTRAYVVNDGDGTVSVIATNTYAVLTTVPVGNAPFGVAITPDGTRAYVTNAFDNTVSVIATNTNTAVATIPVGTAPLGVAVSPDGRYAYVANNADGTVSVITTVSNTVLTTVAVGNGPFGVAVANTPDGVNVYVTNNVDDTVRVVSTASNTPITTIPVGRQPTGVAFTPDGKLACVANTTDNTATVIATADNTPVATIPVGASPIGVAISPDGHHAYVVNNGNNTVSVISLITNAVTVTVPVGRMPLWAAATPDGAWLLVTNNADNTVTVTAAVPFATKTTLSTAPDPSVFGQPKVLTATVTSPEGTPTGTVTYYDGTTPLGTAALNGSGTATLPVSTLSVGSHSLTATYGGDDNFSSSKSNIDVQTVNKDNTTTTLTSAPNPSSVGQPVVLTAHVAAASPGAGLPTGTVTFSEGATTLGVGTLDATGTATLTVPNLAAGQHTLTATYNGDANFNGSFGSTIEGVSGQPTHLTAQPANIVVDVSHLQFYIPVLSATLTDQHGVGIPGRLITFSATPITGPVVLGSAVTDASGTAILSHIVVPATLILAGEYTADFAGDTTYGASTATAPLSFTLFP